MKNMVPCKICLKNFEYSPGFAGNARQLCNDCKETVDEKELAELEEETIVDRNRYLIDAPNRKSEFDPVDILIDGNIPELKSDADRFVCAIEVADFVKKTGISGMEEGLIKFLDSIPRLHRGVFLKNAGDEVMESMMKNKSFTKYSESIMKIVI